MQNKGDAACMIDQINDTLVKCQCSLSLSGLAAFSAYTFSLSNAASHFKTWNHVSSSSVQRRVWVFHFTSENMSPQRQTGSEHNTMSACIIKLHVGLVSQLLSDIFSQSLLFKHSVKSVNATLPGAERFVRCIRLRCDACGFGSESSHFWVQPS